MGRAQRRAALVRAWLMLATSASLTCPVGLPGQRANAQSPLDTIGDPSTGEDSLAPEPTEPTAPREALEGTSGDAVDGPVVVFIAPDEHAFGADGLRDALLAQFALVEAHLSIAPDEHVGEDLALRIAHARRLGAQAGAVAVFWISAQPDASWVVHMMDPRGDRLAMRTVDADPESRDAAVEAVAVIARESTRALLAGEVVDAQPVPSPAAPFTEPGAPPPPQPSGAKLPPARYVTRIAVGYEGTAFSSETDFQHGLGVELSVRGPLQLYGGIGVAWTSTIEVDKPLAFEVSRLPVRVHAGYRHSLPRLRLDADMGFAIEFLSRKTRSSQPGIQENLPNLAIDGDSTKLLYMLSPRIRAEYALIRPVGLYATLGLDFLLNNFSYIIESEPTYRLLRSRRVRPMAGAGVAFYP